MNNTAQHIDRGEELHHQYISLNAKAPGLKNIYKKSLAKELMMKGHDLSHTMRNRHNPKYQVYVFVETPALIADLLELTKDSKRHLA